MSAGTATEDPFFRVLVNQEEQYSLWPIDKAIPPGWSDAGKTGSPEECKAYVDSVWTDMRPLSIRRCLPKGTTGLH